MINPEKVLSPEVDLIAPFEDTPVPLIVIASATVTPPETFKAAPEAIVVAASVVPREVLLLIAATPADIVVAPVYVFAADKVKVPEPVLVKVPEPVAIGSATVMLPAPSKVIFLLEAVIELLDATFKVKVFASDWICA